MIAGATDRKIIASAAGAQQWRRKRMRAIIVGLRVVRVAR
jgi:hypothetical protein